MRSRSPQEAERKRRLIGRTQHACERSESLSNLGSHVGVSFACSDFFYKKKSIARTATPPLSHKSFAFAGTLRLPDGIEGI